MRTNAALPYMVMVRMAHPTPLARVVFPRAYGRQGQVKKRNRT